MTTPNGQLDFYTLQKLLALLNAPAAHAPAVQASEVSAAAFEALRAKVTRLEHTIEVLTLRIANMKGISLIQNQDTGLFHRLLLLPKDADGNAIWDITADRNPYQGI
jgi:hypothetical protein